MHTIYKTDGIVLGVATVGEASIRATILTRDLGLIRVHAQNGRRSPKFRPHLVRFARVTIDVVQGKQRWILTGLAGRGQPAQVGEMLPVLLRLARLTARTVGSDDPNPEIFSLWESILAQAGQYAGELVDPVIKKGFELAAAIELLSIEGYWDGDQIPMEPSGYAEAAAMAKRLAPAINVSLERTQLHHRVTAAAAW